MPTQYGLVTGGGLNLRKQPSTSSDKLIQIPNNTTIAVVDYNDGWYSTTYGAYAGYVIKQYVTLLTTSSDVVRQGAVTGGGLNLRRSASTTADVLIQIPNTTEIEATDYDAESAWYRTGYGGYAGYVMKQYVTLITPPVSGWQYYNYISDTLLASLSSQEKRLIENKYVLHKTYDAMLSELPDGLTPLSKSALWYQCKRIMKRLDEMLGGTVGI